MGSRITIGQGMLLWCGLVLASRLSGETNLARQYASRTTGVQVGRASFFDVMSITSRLGYRLAQASRSVYPNFTRGTKIFHKPVEEEVFLRRGLGTFDPWQASQDVGVGL